MPGSSARKGTEAARRAGTMSTRGAWSEERGSCDAMRTKTYTPRRGRRLSRTSLWRGCWTRQPRSYRELRRRTVSRWRGRGRAQARRGGAWLRRGKLKFWTNWAGKKATTEGRPARSLALTRGNWRGPWRRCRCCCVVRRRSLGSSRLLGGREGGGGEGGGGANQGQPQRSALGEVGCFRAARPDLTLTPAGAGGAGGTTLHAPIGSDEIEACAPAANARARTTEVEETIVKAGQEGAMCLCRCRCVASAAN